VLHADDLIRDRELVSVDDDRLAHAGIVDQLEALVTSVPTPSNIALYGPWGSGKSGIANLLKARIDGSRGRRFVRFDAFKYADVPLRRNFISAIASELKCTDAEFHGDLYTGRTNTEIKVPVYNVVRLIALFASLVLGLMVLLSALLAVVAALQNGEFLTQYRALARQALLAGLLPAALLAAMISLASKTFHIERSLAKPESDEQFEKLFKKLVDKAKAERLVIFVDELDRCAPDEVVATLDTVRTFLGIERCIFIIAADQNVLEEALTRRTKQATPSDEANPYYSTGSAYLDKVFQYQVALPPLLTQRVSGFARNLVEGRGGVWAEINTEYVLSVLVPTHVSSPRRVKHLLNTFVLTYRLAEQRHRAGLLAQHPRDCAPAIARLVCLRVEFPLFARHLEIDARIPDYVLRLRRDPPGELPAGVSARAEALAHAYATGGAAPAVMLSSSTPDGTPDGTPDAEEPEEGGSADVGSTERTVQAHNKQLLNYLSRTRQVSGPSRDLVYLQTTGAGLGLDGELALAIEQAAEVSDIHELRERMDGLDTAAQAAVLDLVAAQIRDSDALTGANAAYSFLRLTGALADLPVDHVLESIIAAISRLHDDGHQVLDELSIRNAWSLVRTRQGPGVETLRRQIITAVREHTDELPADFLLEDASLAISTDRKFAGFLATMLVSSTPQATVDALFGADDDALVTIVSSIRDELAKRSMNQIRVREAWLERSVAGTTARSSVPSAGPEPSDITALFGALADAATGRETHVQHEVLRLLLAVDHESAREASDLLIRHTAATDAPDLIEAVLHTLSRCELAVVPSWLTVVDVEGIGPQHAAPLTTLLTGALEPDAAAPSVTPALTALMPVVHALPEELRPDLTAAVLSTLEQVVATNEDAETRAGQLAVARLLADQGLVDAGSVAAAVVVTLAGTLAQPLALLAPDDPLYRYVVGDGADALRLDGGAVDDSRVRDVLDAAATSPWLDTVARVEVSLRLTAAVATPGSAPAGLPDKTAIVSLVNGYGSPAGAAAALWVELAAPGPDDLALLLDALLATGALSGPFVDAARALERVWSGPQHRSLLDRYLEDARGELPADITLHALGLADAADGEVADLLCTRFATITNNHQRQVVVSLWAKADIHEDSARRRLIETVVVGSLTSGSGRKRNAGAVEIALGALERLGVPLPRGVKGALGEHLLSASAGDDVLERRADRVLTLLGLPPRPKRGFGRRKRRD